MKKFLLLMISIISLIILGLTTNAESPTCKKVVKMDQITEEMKQENKDFIK